MKHIFFILLLLCAAEGYGQSADFISLKKRNKTIKNYFSGSSISFITNSGGNFNVHIDQIRKDSLSVTEFIIGQVPTRLGVYVLDTLARYHYRFHHNEIRSVYYEKKGFSFSRSGASLMGGGLLLILGTGISYILRPGQTSLGLLGVGAGLGVIGYFLTRLQLTRYPIGKKYRLRYVAVTAN